MENNKKRINIIDLIFIIIVAALVIFGVYKLPDVKDIAQSAVLTKVEYVVEVSDVDSEIMKYIEVDDKVFEDESLKAMGTVIDINERPYKLNTEDSENRRITEQIVPDKIAVDIKIAADAEKKNGVISVDSVNVLIGKTIDLNVGDSFVKGVIIDVCDVNEEKGAQE